MKKLTLKQLNVKSFKTSNDKIHGGKGLIDFTKNDFFCVTGPTCPECAFTIPPQFGCDFPIPS